MTESQDTAPRRSPGRKFVVAGIIVAVCIAGFVLREEDAAHPPTEAGLRVYYEGVRPANFEPGKDLVVQGTYDADRELFVANQLMFKCPSKYESKKQGTGRNYR